MALVLRAHYQALKRKRMRKICQSNKGEKDKIRGRFTDGGAEGDSGGLLESQGDPVSPTGVKQPGIC